MTKRKTSDNGGVVGGRPSALLFCNNWPGRLEHDAHLAAAAAEAYGLETIVLTHGRAAEEKALHEGFHHAISIGQPQSLGRVSREELAALSRIERETPGRSLREDIEQDRWLNGRFTLEWSLNYLAQVKNSVDALLNRFDIVAGVGEVNYAAFRLVRRMLEARGKAYLMFSFASVYDRFYLDPTFFNEHPRALTAYQRYTLEGVPTEIRTSAEEAIDRVAVKRQPPNYTDSAIRFDKTNRSWRRSIGKVLRPSGLPAAEQADAYPAERFKHEVRAPTRMHRLIRARRSRRAFQRAVEGSFRGSGRYAVYLLHDSPEYTIDTLGWPYRDQVTLVRHIAESLPIDMYLKVKEHVTMVGRRPASAYDCLLSIPNVDVVHEGQNSMNLIAAADLVFTVSGTAAIEALALGVPAIAFSPVFYTRFKGIVRCTDLLDLPTWIKKALAGEFSVQRDDVVAAFGAIYSASQPGTPLLLTQDWRDPDNLSQEVRGFVTELAIHVPNLAKERL